MRLHAFGESMLVVASEKTELLVQVTMIYTDLGNQIFCRTDWTILN